MKLVILRHTLIGRDGFAIREMNSVLFDDDNFVDVLTAKFKRNN
jgi:hypothetical protein